MMLYGKKCSLCSFFLKRHTGEIMIFDQYPYPEDIPPAEKLGLLMMGYRLTQLVYVAAELHIADILSDCPKSAEELAILLNADPDKLRRIMRALISIGVFDQHENGKYGLNPISVLLCQNNTDSVHHLAIRHGAQWTWLPWGALIHTVRTGIPAFDYVYGQSHWEYLANHPDVREGFNRSMAESTAWVSSEMLRLYVFPEECTVVDVGGGYGLLLSAILKAYPGAVGILLEQADVVQMASEILSQQDVIDRCMVMDGDFFSDIPTNGDVYILQRIIHDWEDARALQILKNCRKAMGESSKLLIVERIMPDTPVSSPVKIVDITVMVLYGGGRERTELEFKALLSEANFEVSRIIPLQSTSSIIEAAGYSIIEAVPL
jgi:hypothetical protein